MAENITIDINALTEAIVEANRRSMGSGGDSGAGNRIYNDADYKRTITALREQRSVLNTFGKMISGTSGEFKDTREELRYLNEQIKENKRNLNSREAQERAAHLTDIRNKLALNSTVTNLNTGIVGVTNTLVKTSSELARGLGTATKTLVESIASGGTSEFRILGNVAGALVNTFGTGASVLGKGVAGMGESLSKLGALGKIVGVPLQALGTAASGVATILSGVLGTAINVLVSQMEATIGAFTSMSQAGAVFSGGMTEMRNLAHGAGYTLEQFSKAVAKNSENLAVAGISVPEAAKRMSGALRAGGDGLKKELLSLGYTLEEHGNLVAETIGRMSYGGGGLRATDQEVQEQTRKYAENLRFISALTGEDVKKRQEAAREQTKTLLFQQKIANMDGPTRIKFQQGFESLDEQMRKNVMDMMAFNGQVINKQGAVIEAISPAYARMGKEIFEGLNAGMDVKDISKIRANYQKEITDDMKRQREFAQVQTAGIGGVASDVARAMGGTLEEYNRITDEAVKNAERNVAGAKTTTDPLTNAYADVTIAVNKLKVIVETLITDMMGDFAKVLLRTVPYIEKGLEMLASALKGNMPAGIPGNPITEGTKDLAKTIDKEKKPVLEKTGEIVGGAAGGLGGYTLGRVASVGLSALQKLGAVGRVIPPAGPLGAALKLLLMGGGAVAGFFLGKDKGKDLGGAAAEAIPDIGGEPVEARAAGGPVRAGRPYLVGELGPELFRPRVDGEIVSAQKTPGALQDLSKQELIAYMRDAFKNLPINNKDIFNGTNSAMVEMLVSSQRNRTEIQAEMMKQFPDLLKSARDVHAAFNRTKFTDNEAVMKAVASRAAGYNDISMGGFNPYKGYQSGPLTIGNQKLAIKEGLFDPETGLIRDGSSAKGAKAYIDKLLDFGSFDFMTHVAEVTSQGGRLLERTEQGLVEVAKFARGGITDGLGIVGEAGPEAVVPLPDGKTIPVNLDSTNFKLVSDSVDRSTKKLENIQTVLQDILRQHGTILSKIENQNREAIRSYSENISAASKTTTNKVDFNPDEMLAELSKSQTSIFNQVRSVITDLFTSIKSKFESPKIETKPATAVLEVFEKSLLTKFNAQKEQLPINDKFYTELTKQNLISKVDREQPISVTKSLIDVIQKGLISEVDREQPITAKSLIDVIQKGLISKVDREQPISTKSFIDELQKGLISKVDRDQKFSTNKFITELNSSIITKVNRVNTNDIEKQYVEVKNKTKDIFSSIIENTDLTDINKESGELKPRTSFSSVKSMYESMGSTAFSETNGQMQNVIENLVSRLSAKPQQTMEPRFPINDIAINELKNILQEQGLLTKQAIDVQIEAVRAMNDLKMIQQQMLNGML